MGQVLRPLFQCLRWRHRQLPFCHLLNLHHSSPFVSSNILFISFFSISYRAVHLRSRGIRVREVSLPDAADDSDDVAFSDNSEIFKSRNEKKREARRAVRWGMELASFSPPQIKRIVCAAALEQEVFDAIMLVKRLGRDVREGKRRQFNYIGGLLREVEPELMDGLIQATKDGDLSKIQNFSGIDRLDIDAEEEEDKETEDEEDKETEDEDEEMDFRNIAVANRWYDGLINKDTSVTNEIYSLRDVEFDRQELRQLVRKVHPTLESQANSEENGKPQAAVNARRSLVRFLRDLAKQLPSE